MSLPHPAGTPYRRRSRTVRRRRYSSAHRRPSHHLPVGRRAPGFSDGYTFTILNQRADVPGRATGLSASSSHSQARRIDARSVAVDAAACERDAAKDSIDARSTMRTAHGVGAPAEPARGCSRAVWVLRMRSRAWSVGRSAIHTRGISGGSAKALMRPWCEKSVFCNALSVCSTLAAKRSAAR